MHDTDGRTPTVTTMSNAGGRHKRAAASMLTALTLLSACTPSEPDAPRETPQALPSAGPASPSTVDARIHVEPGLDPALTVHAAALSNLSAGTDIVVALSRPWLTATLNALDPRVTTMLPPDAREGTDHIVSVNGAIAIVLVTADWRPDETAASLAGVLAAIERETRNISCAHAYSAALEHLRKTVKLDTPSELALPELADCPAPPGAASLRHQHWHPPTGN